MRRTSHFCCAACESLHQRVGLAAAFFDRARAVRSRDPFPSERGQQTRTRPRSQVLRCRRRERAGSERWSICGAQQVQPLAISGKSQEREMPETSQIPSTSSI
jgi:hypothetical protein